MKSKTRSRQTKNIPVSMDPSMAKFVDERVLQLRPQIASRSHYFQLLVDMDRLKGLLAPKSDSGYQLVGALN